MLDQKVQPPSLPSVSVLSCANSSHPNYIKINNFKGDVINS